MSMANPMANSVETPTIYDGCSVEKEFIKLIHMNHLMVLYQIVNYGCVRGPLN